MLAVGLVDRGVAQPSARLLARTAVGCMDEALTRWLDDEDADAPGLLGRARATFDEIAEQMTLVKARRPPR